MEPGRTPKPRRGKATRSYSSAMREAGPFLSFGVQTAGTLLLLIWGGHWIDGRYGSAPWGVLAGAVLGMVGAAALFVKLFAELNARQRAKRPQDGSADRAGADRGGTGGAA